MTVATESQIHALFDHYYGGEPTVIASAPGRVNLIGEHSDYNGGEVLPIAIQQRTYVAARARAGTRTHVVSAGRPDRGSFDAVSPERSGAWWDYVAGVALELRLAGRAAVPADLAIWSEIPSGAGLSSSAALEVASARALLELGSEEMPDKAIALTAWRAEVEFVGVPCGIMDQFASALAREGEALHIRCDTAHATHVPMTDPVLVFDTGVARALRGSRFAQRRMECVQALALLRRAHPELSGLAAATTEMLDAAKLPPPLDRRARHVVTENARVASVVAALTGGIRHRRSHIPTPRSRPAQRQPVSVRASARSLMRGWFECFARGYLLVPAKMPAGTVQRRSNDADDVLQGVIRTVHAGRRHVRLAADAMEHATQALLEADLSVAEQVIADHEHIVEMSKRTESSAIELLALQQPVASDLRTIVSAIHVGADIERMGALAVHVASISRLRHPESALPGEVRASFSEMGSRAVKLARTAQEVLPVARS